MPATERTAIREDGAPQTFTLKDGTVVELRNGCLVEQRSRLVLTGSHQTTGYMLRHGRLTADEHFWWEIWGDITCDSMSSQESFGIAGSGMRRSNRIVNRMEAA